jgi:DNA-3-methyladenine glycosylase II
MQGGRAIQSVAVVTSDKPDDVVSVCDPKLAAVIAAQREQWPMVPTEDPIWGLVRIVIAQQISTKHACDIAERLLSGFPNLSSPNRSQIPTVSDLRSLGVPQTRATSCIEILKRAIEISESVRRGSTWEVALQGVKGIGPWTLATFRIMVLREPDVLPLGDVGLERAIRNIYGEDADVAQLSENWRPYRSVACWYLWRTLGNRQLG